MCPQSQVSHKLHVGDTYFTNRLPIFHKSNRTVAYIKELKGSSLLGLAFVEQYLEKMNIDLQSPADMVVVLVPNNIH